MEQFEELLKIFRKAGVDHSKPGFYDHPNFVAKERTDPTFLQKYAYYVLNRNYDETYLKNVEKEIPMISELICSELFKEGRLGGCVDYSLLLSRILEERGIWNFVVKGSLTIEFPKHTGVNTKFFWSFDPPRQFAAAHCWVVAPPFKIIDLTIKQQPYPKNETLLLPDYICEHETQACEVTDEDLMSYDLREEIFRNQGIKFGQIKVFRPDLLELWEEFQPLQVISNNGINFKYIPVGISAPDTSFRDSTLKYNGLFGIEVYKLKILPYLKYIRCWNVDLKSFLLNFF